MKTNLDLMSEFNLKEIIENGGYIITPKMAQEELKRRENLKYNPFKPYENKIFIKCNELYHHIIKIGQYNSKSNELDCEYIYVEYDREIEQFIIRKEYGFISGREISYKFKEYIEKNNDVWEDYLEKYNISKKYNKELFNL